MLKKQNISTSKRRPAILGNQPKQLDNKEKFYRRVVGKGFPKTKLD
ncbi:hypothetical protein OA340_01510 [Paracoccaceae bacterium]|nr:hypothetical protein [Paracoccaceae bacterium]